jgi:hypothetical protein
MEKIFIARRAFYFAVQLALQVQHHPIHQPCDVSLALAQGRQVNASHVQRK